LPSVPIDVTTKKEVRLPRSRAAGKPVIRLVGPLGYESLR